MSQLDVLIPHFNDPSGLALSLASLANQAWTGDIRAVVCDDGSTDENAAAAQRALHKSGLDHVFLRHRQNAGRPRTRNTLLDAIESPFVAWLDAGDEWYAYKTSQQIDALFRHRGQGGTFLGAIATCNYDWAAPGRRTTPRQQSINQDQWKALLIGNTLRAYLWTMLGSRETFQQVGYFDERLPRLQDLDYCLRFVQMGGKFISPNNPKNKKSLCVYHKSDVGRSAAEIRACNELVLKKNEIAARCHGQRFYRTRRYGAEMLSARFAQSNGDRGWTLYFIGRAALRRPKIALSHLLKSGLSP